MLLIVTPLLILSLCYSFFIRPLHQQQHRVVQRWRQFKTKPTPPPLSVLKKLKHPTTQNQLLTMITVFSTQPGLHLIRAKPKPSQQRGRLTVQGFNLQVQGDFAHLLGLIQQILHTPDLIGLPRWTLQQHQHHLQLQLLLEVYHD